MNLLIWAFPLLITIGLTVHFLKGYFALAPGWKDISIWAFWYFGWIYASVTVLLLTRQEPRLRFEEHVFSVRRVLRFLTVLTAIVASLFFLGLFSKPLRIGLGSPWGEGGFELLACAFCLLIGIYLSCLAQRMNRVRLGRKTIHVTMGLVSVAMLTAILDRAFGISGQNVSETRPLTTLLLGVVGVGGLVYLTRFVLLLFEYRKYVETAWREHMTRREGPENVSR